MFQKCFKPRNSNVIKIITYGGGKKTLTGKHLAGEIMFEFPDHMICRADSFYLGHPIPSLSIEEKLVKGQSYFLLPLDCFSNSNNVLSASSLAVLGLNREGSKSRRHNMHAFRCSNKTKELPFEYLKGSDGRVLIRVLPEFIEKLITIDDDIVDREVEYDDDDDGINDRSGSLCSTPELKKHYNQLVGCNKDQVWSPKLETILEYKIRFSPCRFIGLEWKKKEVDF